MQIGVRNREPRRGKRRAPGMARLLYDGRQYHVAELHTAGPVMRIDLLERTIGKLARGRIAYRPYEVISLLIVGR